MVLIFCTFYQKWMNFGILNNYKITFYNTEGVHKSVRIFVHGLDLPFRQITLSCMWSFTRMDISANMPTILWNKNMEMFT